MYHHYIMDNNDDEVMVLKRNTQRQTLSFQKILNRLNTLNKRFKLNINCQTLLSKIVDQMHNEIKSDEIDELCVQVSASLITVKYEYNTLASAICISNLHKTTGENILSVFEKLYKYCDESGKHCPIIRNELYQLVMKNNDTIENMIDYDRDYLIDYFGFKTLERAYLLKVNKVVVERPQHMWMRVALEIHGDDLDNVKKTYDLLSTLTYTHATPTLFNSGTQRPQLSSCFLLEMVDDSIDGIYDTLKECAQISKWAGGIGLHIHNVRGTGSSIRGTNGTSNGIIPMLRVFNSTARYVDQGGGKRNGSFSIYLEPWHLDVELFLEARKNHGDEEMKARDLFYALWVSDYFMECVNTNSDWYLFCPDKAPGLSDCYGDDFVKLYKTYVEEGKYSKKIQARDLWLKIMDSQMETGTPYMLYKDHANKKSNQKNLGTIKSSNLCCEIIEYSSSTETAVCNLASIALPKFVNPLTKAFDYDKLHEVTKQVAVSLNKLIDVNYYPNEKTRRSNFLHRPIGIGVQGLADVFMLMDTPFTSPAAKEANKLIFETIYHGALTASNETAIARKAHMQKVISEYKDSFDHSVDISSGLNGHNIVDTFKLNDLDVDKCKPIINEIQNLPQEYAGSYSSFVGSPLHEGIFQFDMWNVTPSDKYDWEALRASIKEHGVRNSLMVAPMPTASTSQILGNNECFEPYTSNIYLRRTLAGEFVVVNKHLMNDLTSIGMWSDEVKNNIIENKGSVQQISNLPDNLKEKYKTVWEMSMKDIIDMAADRGAYICQSQSLNLWVEDPTYKILTSMHFYSWRKGLKTGIYYLRRKPKHQPQQFTIAPKKQESLGEEEQECEMCSA